MLVKFCIGIVTDPYKTYTVPILSKVLIKLTLQLNYSLYENHIHYSAFLLD